MLKPIAPKRCSGLALALGSMKRATLAAQIPPERFRSMDGSVPAIGDVIELDQGFTFPDGQPGGLVYCKDKNGKYKYEAEVYESKIGDDIKT